MADRNEGETNPTVRRMEELARSLFRGADNPEAQKSNIEPEKVNWWERGRRWVKFRKKK